MALKAVDWGRYLLTPVLLMETLLITAFPLGRSAVGTALPTFEIHAPTTARLGQSIEMTFVVRHARDVAGYEAVIQFDPTVVTFMSAQQRLNDIDKAGRDVESLAAVEVPYGVAIGAFSCPTLDCGGGPDTSHDNGATGTLKLATISLVTQKSGTIAIDVGAIKVVDHNGLSIPVSYSGTSIAIAVGDASPTARRAAPFAPWSLPTASVPVETYGPFDIASDGRVTHADAMDVAIAWTRLRERSNPCGVLVDAAADVNHDGCVDVADIQIVVAHYTPLSSNQAVGATRPAIVEQDSSSALTPIVNSVGDTADAVLGDGVCLTAFNTCTLRAAIQEANAHLGPDTIRFNIVGPSPRTIHLKGPLPSLFDIGTTIDGYSQPGSRANTFARTSNATIGIEVIGDGEDRFTCFKLTGAGNTIRGLAVFQCNHAFWIFGSGANDNVITGSFVGTNAAGTYGAPTLVDSAQGIKIEQDASGNRIGGTTAAERNVISGNGTQGVATWHEHTDSTIIENNIVGLSPDGTRRIANRKHGIDVNYGSSENIIRDNVVSGNDDTGIEVSHEITTSNNQLLNNRIGTDVTGNAGPAFARNLGRGIMMEDGARGNLIADNVIGNSGLYGIELRFTDVTGRSADENTITRNRIGISLNGTAIPNLAGVLINGRQSRIGPDNTIAYNTYNGVKLARNDADFNTITHNSIFGNGSLGIEIMPRGVNPNDLGDTDAGPNDQLNVPIIDSVTSTIVQGTACVNCVVEVFLADQDARGSGEGQVYLGTAPTDASGGFLLAVTGVATGQCLTATATDTLGNTSEFAQNQCVTIAATILRLPLNLTV